MDQRTHVTSGTAIQSLLQAEMDAAAAVEAARLKAAQQLAAASLRVGQILAAAERRIRKIHASSSQSQEKICRQVQTQGDTELARLQAAWKVDKSDIEKAVVDVARDLIGGHPKPDGT